MMATLALHPTASAKKPFDPADFLIVPAKTFEDLKVGDVFRAPSRTLTDAHTSEFQAISSDNHPRHYNQDYAKAHGMPAMLVQPLQVLAFSAPGATLFTHYVGEVLQAFAGLSCEFVKDCYVGDTLYTSLEVSDLSTQDDKGLATMDITIVNHDGDLVLTGKQHFVFKLTRH